MLGGGQQYGARNQLMCKLASASSRGFQKASRISRAWSELPGRSTPGPSNHDTTSHLSPSPPPTSPSQMTSKIPAGLKAADITRFATRATQLEKFKPVISYWCECPT